MSFVYEKYRRERCQNCSRLGECQSTDLFMPTDLEILLCAICSYYKEKKEG